MSASRSFIMALALLTGSVVYTQSAIAADKLPCEHGIFDKKKVNPGISLTILKGKENSDFIVRYNDIEPKSAFDGSRDIVYLLTKKGSDRAFGLLIRRSDKCILQYGPISPEYLSYLFGASPKPKDNSDSDHGT